jgi:hypothetical protein
MQGDEEGRKNGVEEDHEEKERWGAEEKHRRRVGEKEEEQYKWDRDKIKCWEVHCEHTSH